LLSLVDGAEEAFSRLINFRDSRETIASQISSID
jgi:hypothetical protein